MIASLSALTEPFVGPAFQTDISNVSLESLTYSVISILFRFRIYVNVCSSRWHIRPGFREREFPFAD